MAHNSSNHIGKLILAMLSLTLSIAGSIGVNAQRLPENPAYSAVLEGNFITACRQRFLEFDVRM